jgi:hypothetical protein
MGCGQSKAGQSKASGDEAWRRIEHFRREFPSIDCTDDVANVAWIWKHAERLECPFTAEYFRVWVMFIVHLRIRAAALSQRVRLVRMAQDLGMTTAPALEHWSLQATAFASMRDALVQAASGLDKSDEPYLEAHSRWNEKLAVVKCYVTRSNRQMSDAWHWERFLCRADKESLAY